MKRKIIILALVLLFAGFYRSMAQQIKPVVFNFAVQSDEFHLYEENNRSEMQRLKAWLSKEYNGIYADSLAVFVYGYCASGGERDQRFRLAVARSNRVKASLIELNNMAEEYFITTNSSLGFSRKQSEAVRIVIRQPLPHERLERNIERRRASGKPVFGETSKPPAEQSDGSKPEQTKPEQQWQSPQQSTEYKPEAPPQIETEPAPVKKSRNFATSLQARTNLLYWLAATPNLGIEWRPRLNLGFSMNGAWSHWTLNSEERQHRVWMLQPELRFYFGANNCWFVGGEFHAGEFNFKFSDTGYQGDAIGGGLMFGYRMYLSRLLDLDFSLGLGCTRIEYESYFRSNGYMVKQNSGLVKDVWGPSQAGISLFFKM